MDLSTSVVAARSWRRADLPRYLKTDEVERLVRSCDLSTQVGRRDRAILLLLARLGLRATEVIAMTLDDVDWRAGEILGEILATAAYADPAFSKRQAVT